MRGRLIVWLAAGVVGVAVSAHADLTWRVDFNGASGSTESVSNFTPWVVSGTSRTQTFANVDGGAVSSNLTISLTGSGGTTYNTYDRNMPISSSTNLFRDGAQYNGVTADSLTLQMTGLSAGQSYTLRLWYYDYSYSGSAVQSYTDLTGGGSLFLGSLTNTVNGSAAGLPTGLYDSRYVLEASVTAGASGELGIQLSTAASNQKINGLELVAGVVPEPSTIALVAVAMGALALRRRKR